MVVNNNKNYMDDPKKNKSDNENQTENLIYDGETLKEKKEKEEKYKNEKLNE